MHRINPRLVAVTITPFLVALAVSLGCFAAFREELPARIATHFGGSGQADDYTGHTGFVLVNVGLFVLMGLLWVAVAAKADSGDRSARGMTAAGYALAGFLGYLMAALVLVNRGVTEGDAAMYPMWHLLLACAVAALAAGAGLLAFRLLPPPSGPSRAERSDDPSRRIDLPAGVRAGWARRTGSWWMLALGLGLVALSLVFVFVVETTWLTAVLMGLVGVLVTLLSRPYVSVDRRGLTVSTGMVPWVRIRVPLDGIEQAESRKIDALGDFGGWGYRVRSKRSGLIFRSGEALVVRRAGGGREFAVTVEDSATAAALLNTLADRRRAGH